MKVTSPTEQEKFWAGTFGDEYTDRNTHTSTIINNVALFSKILSHTHDVTSIIEFGANSGLAIQACKQLKPHADISALEINDRAVLQLKKIALNNIYHTSLLDFTVDYQRDFVFTKAVLIHIDPEHLKHAYDILYQTSKRYICLMEFYNPTPIDVVYRGHANKLFKRDFAGEMLDMHQDLKLIDYGFAYHRDPHFPQGDLHWFLMEKTR